MSVEGWLPLATSFDLVRQSLVGLRRDPEQELRTALVDGSVCAVGRDDEHHTKENGRLWPIEEEVWQRAKVFWLDNFIGITNTEMLIDRIVRSVQVEASSLQQAFDLDEDCVLAALPRPAPKPTRRPHRPSGRSLEVADRAIVDRMAELCKQGEVPSPTQAALKLLGADGLGAVGSGSIESKVRRLTARYRTLYGE